MRDGREEPAAILLAAGSGSRFGGGRGAKLLADFQGKPLVTHAMEVLVNSPVERVFVVVSDASGEIASLARGFGFEVVENADADAGQATSISAGLRAAEESADFGAAVVMLGDQPLVGAAVVSRLLEAYRDGARVVVATYFQERRNPALFSRDVWDELLVGLIGDEGARSFMKARPELVVEVECGDIGDAVDVDTREDLHRLERGS